MRFNPGHCPLAVLLLTALSVPPALGGNFFLKPISATGPHTINGNQIILDGAGQQVTFELRVDDWAIVEDVGVCNDNTLCSVSAQDCAAGSCLQHNGLIAVYQARIDGDSSFQGILSPVLLPPQELIDTDHPEYIYSGLTAIAAVDTSSQNYAYGSVLIIASQAPAYGGVDKYGGTLVLDVPAGAVGTFEISFNPSPNETLMLDQNSTFIVPLTTESGFISIACQTNTDCDDGNACTTDICNPDDTCTNTPNFDSAFCCNPADGSLTQIDDGNDCTDDVCDEADGSVTHDDLPAGSICGSQANTECDNPDTCDGAGTCEDNLEPSGAACGDPADSDCDGADTCDGAGTCLNNILPPGAACGDPTDSDCTNPDACDGIGNCLINDAPNGLTCDDGLFCNENEICIDGICAGGLAQSCDDSLPCTDDSCDEDADTCVNDLVAGNCLINGACYADGEFNPDNTCEECNVANSTTEWTQRPEGAECDDGNACTGTGSPGVGVDTCDAEGVCMGMVDPNCNDNCATSVEVFPGANAGTNTTASPEDDAEALCQPVSNNDVWFVYNATCDGELAISTTGSLFAPENDTVLSVYDSCGGTEIACNDDGGPGLLSALTIMTQAGSSYFIRVAGFEDNVGDIVLNINPIGDCVIDGICYENGAVNPDNECQECVADVANTEWTSRLRGTACGDQADTECDSPDACDGLGVCETNFKPDGTACMDDANECSFDVCQSGMCTHPPVPQDAPCGDPLDNECDNPDTCDGAGTCLDNFELMGVACGDPSSDQCDQADICDGLGDCSPNYEPTGTACDDSDVCTEADECDSGVCAGSPLHLAPDVQGLGSVAITATPLPAAAPGPIALLLTSTDWTCLSLYIQEDGDLGPDPFFQTVDEWGTVSVNSIEIVPESSYSVQAECGAFLSPAGTGMTGIYGDIDGSGRVNLADIQLIVLGFQGNFSINSIEELDIWPCEPNGVVNFDDIQRAVLIFQQTFSYEDFGCPLPCPE